MLLDCKLTGRRYRIPDDDLPTDLELTPGNRIAKNVPECTIACLAAYRDGNLRDMSLAIENDQISRSTNAEILPAAMRIIY